MDLRGRVTKIASEMAAASERVSEMSSSCEYGSLLHRTGNRRLRKTSAPAGIASSLTLVSVEVME